MKKTLTIILLMISFMGKTQNNFNVNLVGGFDLSPGAIYHISNKEKSFSLNTEMGLRFKIKKMKPYQKSESFTNLYFLSFYEVSKISTTKKQRITSFGLKGQIQLIENKKKRFNSGLLVGIRAGYSELKKELPPDNLPKNLSGLVFGVNFGFIFFEPVSLIIGFNYDEFIILSPRKETFGKLSLNMGTRINIK